jgi:hypothetical protein
MPARPHKNLREATMRFMAVVLTGLLATGQAMAQTSREDKIAYIIKTEDFRGQILAYKEEMAKRFAQELSAKSPSGLTEEQKHMVKEETAEAGDEYVDDYIDEIVGVYLEVFTEEEINAFYKFYHTPEGISLGSKLPDAFRKIFWIDARYLEMISEDAMSRIAERLKQDGAN